MFTDEDYDDFEDYSDFEYLESSVSEVVRIAIWTAISTLLVIGGALLLIT